MNYLSRSFWNTTKVRKMIDVSQIYKLYHHMIRDIIVTPLLNFLFQTPNVFYFHLSHCFSNLQVMLSIYQIKMCPYYPILCSKLLISIQLKRKWLVVSVSSYYSSEMQLRWGKWFLTLWIMTSTYQTENVPHYHFFFCKPPIRIYSINQILIHSQLTPVTL